MQSRPPAFFSGQGCESETLKVLLEDVVLICKTEVVPAPEQPDKQTDTAPAWALFSIPASNPLLRLDRYMSLYSVRCIGPGAWPFHYLLCMLL